MRLICSACGTAVQFVEDESVAFVACPGCGKRLSVAAPTDAEAPADEWAFTTAGTVRPSAPRPPKNSADHTHHVVIAAMSVVMLAAVAVAAYLLATRPVPPPVAVVAATTQPTWDQLHRSEVLQLKAAAADDAVHGDLTGAFELYQKIAALVAPRELTDTVLITAVADARAEQGKVFSLLLAQRTPVPAATAPTTSAVPVRAGGSIFDTTRPTTVATTAPVKRPSTTNPADDQPSIAGVPPGPRMTVTNDNDGGVTDAQIGEAINKGIGFLKLQFHDGVVDAGLDRIKVLGPSETTAGGKKLDGTDGDDSDLGNLKQPNKIVVVNNPNAGSYGGAFCTAGFDALAAYALLHSGQATDQKLVEIGDPFTTRMLTVLKQLNIHQTYIRSLRASCLAVYNRAEDREALEADVAWLVRASDNGGYSYASYDENRSAVRGRGIWDNSNSQYGLLGVWSGAEVGINVPAGFWTTVASHWSQCQCADGTWDYTNGGNTGALSMTFAGTASELVCQDFAGSMPAKTNRLTPADRALQWLDKGDNATAGLVNAWPGYTLYGLERVGLASGYKYFGTHDWYAEFARGLVAQQRLDGSWNADDKASRIMNTSYALLFLSRGRHPILFNKMRYDGDWNHHPRAVSHLAKFAGKTLERPLNWQVVNFARPWFDWMDSPVLYLSGTDEPKLRQADYEQLKAFAEGGGLIFTNADQNSEKFDRWVDKLVRLIFPAYELGDLPADHPIYSMVFPVKNPPPLKFIGNGSRVLLIHSPTDLGDGWQSNWTSTKSSQFQLGTNLFVYAAGKANFKNRLSSPYIPDNGRAPAMTYPVARLRYAGHWDPEPYAWTRFGRLFASNTNAAISARSIDMTDLKPSTAPLAVLTGTVRYDFLPSEVKAAREYVDAGGVLLIDACGGGPEFAKSAQQTLVTAAFPDATLSPLPDNHSLLLASRPGADDLRTPLLRPFATQNGGRSLPLLGFAHGKGRVILSRLDLTTGLLGTNQWGISGYDPNYAAGLMKNAVLWAAARSAGAMIGGH